MKYTDQIGMLLNNISWDDSTDLNITTKPFQIANVGTPNTPNNQSFAVWTIKNGPNYGAQLAISILTTSISYRGLNVGVWGPWKTLLGS